MKILAIFASPRVGGTVDQMLCRTLKAAEAAGHSAERVELYPLALAPCTACMKCRESGRCILPDGAELLRQKLAACDIVVLAAPTYWANVPGPVKTMFDRLSGAAMGESERGVPRGRFSKRQRYLLLTACSTPRPFHRLLGQSAGCLRAMEEFFRTAGMRRLGRVVCPGTKSSPGLSAGLIRKLEGYWK